MNKHVVGWERTRTKLKFVHVKMVKSVNILYPQGLGLKHVIQALELHGCMFPGSLLLHLDNEKWKHTVFTNKPCISAFHFVKTIHT